MIFGDVCCRQMSMIQISYQCWAMTQWVSSKILMQVSYSIVRSLTAPIIISFLNNNSSATAEERCTLIGQENPRD